MVLRVVCCMRCIINLVGVWVLFQSWRGRWVCRCRLRDGRRRDRRVRDAQAGRRGDTASAGRDCGLWRDGR